MNRIKNIYQGLFRGLVIAMTTTFLAGTIMPIPRACATDLNLPVPGTMVQMTNSFLPAVIKGIKIDPQNPLLFEFLMDPGQTPLSDEGKATEYRKLIKYFLASLTTPEGDMWVNLSPYEKNRKISHNFGSTEMGRDMLAQDYILKQLAASLVYPEDSLGKIFWNKIYERVRQQTGSADIPVNTFNKIWILPASATIFEKGNVAVITKSRLKVMMEEDYLSLAKHDVGADLRVRPKRVDTQVDPYDKNVNRMASQTVRDIVLPAIEKEVNEGQNFAQLRQMYQSMILASWFKQRLKKHVLSKVYVNQDKVQGVELQDLTDNERVYQRYLQAFKKGAYNYIKDEPDAVTGQMVAKKYFSGGTDYAQLAVPMGDSRAIMEGTDQLPAAVQSSKLEQVRVTLELAESETNVRRIQITSEVATSLRNAAVQQELATFLQRLSLPDFTDEQLSRLVGNMGTVQRAFSSLNVGLSDTVESKEIRETRLAQLALDMSEDILSNEEPAKANLFIDRIAQLTGVDRQEARHVFFGTQTALIVADTGLKKRIEAEGINTDIIKERLRADIERLRTAIKQLNGNSRFASKQIAFAAKAYANVGGENFTADFDALWQMVFNGDQSGLDMARDLMGRFTAEELTEFRVFKPSEVEAVQRYLSIVKLLNQSPSLSLTEIREIKKEMDLLKKAHPKLSLASAFTEQEHAKWKTIVDAYGPISPITPGQFEDLSVAELRAEIKQLQRVREMVKKIDIKNTELERKLEQIDARERKANRLLKAKAKEPAEIVQQEPLTRAITESISAPREKVSSRFVNWVSVGVIAASLLFVALSNPKPSPSNLGPGETQANLNTPTLTQVEEKPTPKFRTAEKVVLRDVVLKEAPPTPAFAATPPGLNPAPLEVSQTPPEPVLNSYGKVMGDLKDPRSIIAGERRYVFDASGIEERIKKKRKIWIYPFKLAKKLDFEKSLDVQRLPEKPFILDKQMPPEAKDVFTPIFLGTTPYDYLIKALPLTSTNTKGGIDFDPQYLQLNVQNEGEVGIAIPKGFDWLLNTPINGFTPRILSIQSGVGFDLSFFQGLEEPKQRQSKTQSNSNQAIQVAISYDHRFTPSTRTKG